MTTHNFLPGTIVHGDPEKLAKLPYWNGRTDKRWTTPGSWGRDGWDLGEWPYVMYAWIDVDDDTFGYLSYCEGDRTVMVFDTKEERDAELDSAALFHWVNRNESWVQAIAKRRGKDTKDLTIEDLPPKFRGHFSWARLNREGER